MVVDDCFCRLVVVIPDSPRDCVIQVVGGKFGVGVGGAFDVSGELGSFTQCNFVETKTFEGGVLGRSSFSTILSRQGLK